MKNITTHETPFYAVIFVSTKKDDLTGYYELDDELIEMAQKQAGFMNYEVVKNENKSIFISYWKDEKSIEDWKNNSRHLFAKQGAHQWYHRWLSQICKVESSREFNDQ
jgi:heme-degrading monooxygenase HmoA